MAAPDGSSRRPAPRPTTDDGTLTRERHRLACGSPSRAPGRRPGGVTLRFSDRCPVHDGDGDLRFRAAPWWSTRFPTLCGAPHSVGNLAGDRCRPGLRRGREIPTLPQRIIIIDTDTETTFIKDVS